MKLFTAQVQLCLLSGLGPLSLKARACGGCWGSSAEPSDFPERYKMNSVDIEIILKLHYLHFDRKAENSGTSLTIKNIITIFGIPV